MFCNTKRSPCMHFIIFEFLLTLRVTTLLALLQTKYNPRIVTFVSRSRLKTLHKLVFQRAKIPCIMTCLLHPSSSGFFCFSPFFKFTACHVRHISTLQAVINFLKNPAKIIQIARSIR